MGRPLRFFGSPSWYASNYKFRGVHHSGFIQKEIPRWCSLKIEECPEKKKKKSQSIRYGKVASHRTCQTTSSLHVNRQTERGNMSCWKSERNLIFFFATLTCWCRSWWKQQENEKKSPKKTKLEMQARATPRMYFFVEVVRRTFTGKPLIKLSSSVPEKKI